MTPACGLATPPLMAPPQFGHRPGRCASGDPQLQIFRLPFRGVPEQSLEGVFCLAMASDYQANYLVGSRPNEIIWSYTAAIASSTSFSSSLIAVFKKDSFRACFGTDVAQ